MKKKKIAILEPLAHSPGHYSYFLLKMCKVFREADYEVDAFTGIAVEDIEKEIPVKNTINKNVYFIIKRISYLPIIKRFKRIIYIDILSLLALIITARSHKNILFISTFFLIPYLYYYLFLKNSHNVKFYRFQQSYFKKPIVKHIANKVTALCSQSIFFQSRPVNDEFFKKTAMHANYLPIPISPIKSKTRKVPCSEIRKLLGNKQNTEILIFGINHINKDTTTLVKAIEYLPSTIRKKVRLIIAGVQINHPGRVTGDEILEKHSNTIVINRKITEDEKILLFSRADYCFAGFKKDFTSSSGVLVDCIELQVPFLSTKQQEISQSFIKDKNCVIYEPGNFKELSALMKSKILKNGKRIDKKVKVPLEMTKKYFFETLSF